MRNKLFLFLFFVSINFTFAQQLPNPVLVGYWQSWNSPSAPFIPLDQVDTTYNVVNLSFAVPKSGTTYDMVFSAYNTTQAQLITQIQTLKSQGTTVNLSIGGGGTLVQLNDTAQRDVFIVSMLNLINTYDFDGIDIDLESGSVSVSGGTITNPVDPPIIHMTEAIKRIMRDYAMQHGKKLILTMAPETAFVQGGQSNYSGIWGGYLPIIDALRDSIDMLHVQLYNSGTMFGIDGAIYTQGTADFIVAMGEAVIQGFNTLGGFFGGLAPPQVAIGLPACPSAAGGGFTDTATVSEAMKYLLGKGPQPGSYTLADPNGYPNLRGMMTWSINWDKINTCGEEYEYAANFKKIYNIVGVATKPTFGLENQVKLFPNPATDRVNLEWNTDLDIEEIQVFNLSGQTMPIPILFDNQLDVSQLVGGYYLVVIQTNEGLVRKKLVVVR